MRFRGVCVVLLCGLALSSCAVLRYFVIRGSYSMHNVMKIDADPMTKQGLYDGCYTANWTRGNSLYRSVLSFRQNPKLVNNTLYNSAWSRGYLYCFQGVNMESYMSLGARFTGPHVIGDIIDPKGQTPTMYVGSGDHRVQWFLNQDINNAIPGVDNYGDPKANEMFGFFGYGKCHFCP